VEDEVEGGETGNWYRLLIERVKERDHSEGFGMQWEDSIKTEKIG
jgi:hypothetical protein